MNLTKWDIEYLERMANGDKNAGRIVKTKTGKIGRTYNHEEFVNGKLVVHVEGGKLLCDPSSIKVTGYVN